MKKIFTMLMLTIGLVSCATTRYANQRSVTAMDEVSYVLANYYPQLHEYYMEGVLRVNSLKEIVLQDGTVDYKVKYDFVRYYYRDFNEKMQAVKETYPEIYEMYISGVIDINSVYKYVDRDTGRIKLHVSYSRIYDYYYRHYPGAYGGTHIYRYGPRPYPLAPRRMQPAPPQPRPEPNRPRPDVRPNDRPNNPPQGNPGGNVRPNNPPRQGGNTGGATRPSNPPRQQGGNPGGASRSSGGNSSRGRR